jgi:hypothetical protein
MEGVSIPGTRSVACAWSRAASPPLRTRLHSHSTLAHALASPRAFKKKAIFFSTNLFATLSNFVHF